MGKTTPGKSDQTHLVGCVHLMRMAGGMERYPFFWGCFDGPQNMALLNAQKPWLITDEWLLQWTFPEGSRYPKKHFRWSILTKKPCGFTHWSSRLGGGFKFRITFFKWVARYTHLNELKKLQARTFTMNCENVWKKNIYIYIEHIEHGDSLASHVNRVCDECPFDWGV